jgi:hypothetical protein
LPNSEIHNATRFPIPTFLNNVEFESRDKDFVLFLLKVGELLGKESNVVVINQCDRCAVKRRWSTLAEMTSGRTGSQQEPGSNLQGPLEISVDTRNPEEGAGLADELLGAMKKG